MNKIAIIIGREYFVRVKQKMFLLATLGLPLLFIGFYVVLFFLMMKEDTTERTIAIINHSELRSPLESNETTTFEYVEPSTDYKELINDEKYYAILQIPYDVEISSQAKLYSNKQVPIEVSMKMSNKLEEIISQRKIDKLTNELGQPHLKEQIDATKTNIKLTSIRLVDGEEKKSSSLAASILSGLAMGSGVIIFFLVVTYGGIVMKGVVEEKSNRIIEVIISSVKPIQLMIGKIAGIALVGITQIAIWAILFTIIAVIGSAFLGMTNIGEAQEFSRQSEEMSRQLGSDGMSFVQEAIASVEIGTIIKLIFIGFIYTLLGYILYASLYAAVGAAADNETDTQQLSLPITLPLFIAFYVAINVARNPESSLAFWTSMIPFTSPIVMPVRIPFDVPWWELLLSIAILIITIIGCVMLAAKIYRTGILMYGKKVSWKELAKWIKYKN